MQDDMRSAKIQEIRAEIRNTPSPRQVEATTLEARTKNKELRENIKEFGVARYPTPTKKIKSITKLKKRIEQFFDYSYHSTAKQDKNNARETVNDLALWLGYSSRNTLMQAIATSRDNEPEYAEWLEYAVSKLEDRFDKEWLDTIRASTDPRAIDQYAKFIERMDKLRATSNPKDDEKQAVNISINIAKNEIVNEAIDKSIDSLFGKINKPVVIEADVDDDDGLIVAGLLESDSEVKP